jgi:hypothetical protein
MAEAQHQGKVHSSGAITPLAINKNLSVKMEMCEHTHTHTASLIPSAAAEPNLETHFLIDRVESYFPHGPESKRAYLVWVEDKNGHLRKMCELNLAQLGVKIIQQPDASSPGRGWLYFIGNIKEKYYLKD